MDLILGYEDPVLPLYSKREDRFSSSILGLLSELPSTRNQILAQLLGLDVCEIFSVIEIQAQYPGWSRPSRPDGRLLVILNDVNNQPTILRIVALEAKMRGYPLDREQLGRHCETLKISQTKLSSRVETMIQDEIKGRKTAFIPPEIKNTELQLLILHSEDDAKVKPDGRKSKNIEISHVSWKTLCRMFTDNAIYCEDKNISWLLQRIFLKMREVQRFALENDKVNENNAVEMIEIAVSLAIKNLESNGAIYGYAKKYKGKNKEAKVRKEWTRHGVNFAGDNYQWQFIGYVNGNSNMGAELFAHSDWGENDKRLLLSIDVDPYDERTKNLRQEIKKHTLQKIEEYNFNVEFPSENSVEGANHPRWRQVIWSMKKEDLIGMNLADIVHQLVEVTLAFSEIREWAIKTSHWKSP